MQMMSRAPLEKESVVKKKKKRDHFILLGIPYYLILLILIIIPVLLIFYYGFTYIENGLLHITLREFQNVLENKIHLEVIYQSVKAAVITTIICLLIGYPTAYLITKTKPRTQGLLILAITAPMWINMLLRILAWRQIFESNGIVAQILSIFGIDNVKILGSNFAIIFGLVYNFLPFMIIPIYTVLNKMDKRLIEASYDLGGSKFHTFRRIIFPLSLSGVMSGVIMVLLPAATAIVVPNKLGDNKMLIGGLIEYLVKNDLIHYVSALAIVLALIIFALLYLSKLVEKKYEEI